MPQGLNLIIDIDARKSYLTSQTRVYKTQRFIEKTSGFFSIDKFISKLAEGVIRSLSVIMKYAEKNASTDMDCFKIETLDKVHAFYIKLGLQTPTQSGVQTQSKFNKEDIIFYDYFDAEDIKRQNDQRLVLISQDDFQISLTSHKDMVESLFSKCISCPMRTA